MIRSVQQVVRGMVLPAGYNQEALQQLADIADAQADRIEVLEDENERLWVENEAWQNQGLLEQCNRQADEIKRLRAALLRVDTLAADGHRWHSETRYQDIREIVRDALAEGDEERG